MDRSDPENLFKFEIDFLVGKKQLGKIIDKCIKVHGTAMTADVLDAVKAQGYKYSTKSAITVAVCDATIPPKQKKILDCRGGEKDRHGHRAVQERVCSPNDERYNAVLRRLGKRRPTTLPTRCRRAWTATTRSYMMADSGARGSMSQIRQLAGMRGLIANTSGTDY